MPSFIVAISAGLYAHNLALVARTDYDVDLLVSGTGVRANLNRSITVASDASIESTMYCYNNPTMAVAGTTTITGPKISSRTAFIWFVHPVRSVGPT